MSIFEVFPLMSIDVPPFTGKDTADSGYRAWRGKSSVKHVTNVWLLQLSSLVLVYRADVGELGWE